MMFLKCMRPACHLLLLPASTSQPHMGACLDIQAVDLDVDKLDKHIDRMMPELGFSPEDNDRLVASYSGGWQMRMCLGKILLQEPDLLLLDEPTNHLDLEAIEWLEGAPPHLLHVHPADGSWFCSCSALAVLHPRPEQLLARAVAPCQ